MQLQQIEKILKERGEPKYRLEQITKAIYKDGISSFSKIQVIPKELREILTKEIKILSFNVEKALIANNKQTIKALLRLSDGNLIETVLISPKPKTWSACISVQVGCPMGCRFCATGTMGFKKNLTSEEIVDQVLFWRQYLKKNKIPGSFSNIVYMGMGEPFMNWENVKEGLKNLIDKNLFGFGSRSISVSTSGIPEGIEKLAEEFPQVNLALSLHFADDELRKRFMPIGRKYSLGDLKNALQKYFKKTRRKVFIEYIMLDGINDDKSHAGELVKFLKSIGNIHLLHVNLIRYNITPANLKPSPKIRTQEFKSYLLKNKIHSTIRKSLGEEIQGACGQLAGD